MLVLVLRTDNARLGSTMRLMVFKHQLPPAPQLTHASITRHARLVVDSHRPGLGTVTCVRGTPDAQSGSTYTVTISKFGDDFNNLFFHLGKHT